jgi:hypothetical protein
MKKSFYFLIFFPLLLSLSCGGGGGSSSGGGVSSSTPIAGKWSGTNIQFYVSTDGTSITTSGSTLALGSSLILGPVPYSGSCSGNLTYDINSLDFPITNHTFSVDLGHIILTGHFTASNTANGQYSFSLSSCGGTISGSGNWTASPS